MASYGPKEKFSAHRRRAEKRGILFTLTFEEWMQIWLESGKFEQRGPHRGQYAMARLGDVGPYAVGNVVIKTTDGNIAERRPWNRGLNGYRKRRKQGGCGEP